MAVVVELCQAEKNRTTARGVLMDNGVGMFVFHVFSYEEIYMFTGIVGPMILTVNTTNDDKVILGIRFVQCLAILVYNYSNSFNFNLIKNTLQCLFTNYTYRIHSLT